MTFHPNFSQLDYYITNFINLSTHNFYQLFKDKFLCTGAFSAILPIDSLPDKILCITCDPLKHIYTLLDNQHLPKYQIIKPNIIKQHLDTQLTFNCYIADKLLELSPISDNKTKRITEDITLTSSVYNCAIPNKYERYTIYLNDFIPSIKSIDPDIANAISLLIKKAIQLKHDFFIDSEPNNSNIMLHPNGTIILNDIICDYNLIDKMTDLWFVD